MGKSRVRRCLFDVTNTTPDENLPNAQESITPTRSSGPQSKQMMESITYKAALLSSEESLTIALPSSSSNTTSASAYQKKSNKKRSTTKQAQLVAKSHNTKVDLLVDSPLHNSAERVIQRPSPSACKVLFHEDDDSFKNQYSLFSGPASPFFSTSRASSYTESERLSPCSLFSHNLFFDATQS